MHTTVSQVLSGERGRQEWEVQVWWSRLSRLPSEPQKRKRRSSERTGKKTTSAWHGLLYRGIGANLILQGNRFVFQPLSCIQLFVTPWTAACQASLSFAISWSLLKFMSIESMMASNHLILCRLLLLLPSVFPSIRVFSSETALHIRWLKYWSFRFGISPSSEYSGLISFRINWFDLLVVYYFLFRTWFSHLFHSSNRSPGQPSSLKRVLYEMMPTLGSYIYRWIWCSLSFSLSLTHTHTNWPKKHFLSLGPQTSLTPPCLSSVKSSPTSALLFFLPLTTYVFKKLNLDHLKREFRPVEWKRVRGAALKDVYLTQQLYHWRSV